MYENLVFMNTLFYIFASLMLMSGDMVIQSRNTVYSVLFIILMIYNSYLLDNNTQISDNYATT